MGHGSSIFIRIKLFLFVEACRIYFISVEFYENQQSFTKYILKFILFSWFFPTLSSSLEYSFLTWNLSIFRPYLAVFFSLNLQYSIVAKFADIQKYDRFFVVLYVCLRFEYFQPSAELCFFVHIILQVCEILFKISMCICSVRN